MIVYVSAASGNVRVRSGPSTSAEKCAVAYNYSRYGILYETIDEQENTGEKWYLIRGLGWAMAKFFTVYDGQSPDEPEFDKWLVGLDAMQIEACIEYLRGALESGRHGNVDAG